MLRLIKLIIIFFILGACSSAKDVYYLQDVEQVSYKVNYNEYRLKIDDVLKIDVKSINPETVLMFNPKELTNSLSANRESLLFEGYQIDTNGFIHFPALGKLYLKDLSVNEARELIISKIKNNDILKEFTVDIKILNASFTILGEVKSPGTYTFVENNLTIFDAIGLAGDLTIYGSRDNIKIIREDNKNNKTITSLSLKSSDLISDDYYQIFSGDVIIVNPNKTRVKNAGVIGNAGNLLSLLSFILSSIILITNN